MKKTNITIENGEGIVTIASDGYLDLLKFKAPTVAVWPYFGGTVAQTIP